jgi:hypothetical protein
MGGRLALTASIYTIRFLFSSEYLLPVDAQAILKPRHSIFKVQGCLVLGHAAV